MKLVIAEKPSVGRTLAAVLGASKKQDGYLEGNGWLVSWCVGHLAELASAENYDPKYAKWRREDLPILPENWQYSIGRDKRDRFNTLRELLLRDDVSEVVNACDAGREGERIFRAVYHLTHCTKPMKRLWMSSMEDAAIREGFQNLKPGSDYDGLYDAALCRTQADWLVGINASRLFSLTYGCTLNVGRVMSPTLALIVQRETEIAAFHPVPFYTSELSCGGMVLMGERMDHKADAEAVVSDCRNGEAVIRSVERKEKFEKFPALYDLTALQRDANRLLGYTAQQTLDYLQALYEKKLCTYPRTDSRYLTDDMESGVPALADAAAALCGVNVPAEICAKQVCNSGKVSDHHAVVPIRGAAKADLDTLPLGEREILRLVSLQLLRAVCPPYRYAETTLTADCGGHSFTVKGRETLEPGWKAYGEASRENLLPDGLTEGKKIPVESAAVKEGKTSPPKHHTEDSILAAMENAGGADRVPAKSQDFVGKGGAAERVSFPPQGGNERCAACDDAPEEAERRGIGTPATRAGILEKLVSAKLVERKKVKKATHLIPTQTGVSLITVLPEELQSPILTAEWEHRLLDVERGTLDPSGFMDGIAAMVTELVRTYKAVPGADVLFPSGKEVIGKCPRCGGNVTEGKQGYFCENRACRFVLWKENRFFAAKKKVFTKAIAAALLKDGRVLLKGCHSERTGKPYDATVILEDNGVQTNYKLEFGHG